MADAGGGVKLARTIEDVHLDGAVLRAWCRLRDDERAFSPDRIRRVSEA